VQALDSVPAWRQPLPSPASADRTAVTGEAAARIPRLSPGRLRAGVDGLTAAGKTSFGQELAAALRGRGRPAMRASMDDFKHPRRHARELRYDQVTGEGCYRNAYDFASARNLLPGPAGPGRAGEVVLCAHDPLTGEDHRDTKISPPDGAVLIAGSAFAFRPGYNDCWEYRIWLDVDAETALRRGIARDSAIEGTAGATRLHRDRYHAAETIYLAEIRPQALADLIIDNRDYTRPRILDNRST
jgi:uridine kinase